MSEEPYQTFDNDKKFGNQLKQVVINFEITTTRMKSVVEKFSFTDRDVIETGFAKALSLLKYIGGNDLTYLSQQKAEQMRNWALQFNNMFENDFRALEKELADSSTVADGIKAQQIILNAYCFLIELLDFLASVAAFFSSNTVGSVYVLQEISDDITNNRNETAKVKDEALRLLKIAQSAAGKQVAENYAEQFKLQGEKHETVAFRWLMLAALLIVSVIGIVVWQIIKLEDLLESKEILNMQILPYLAVSKFVVITTILFALSIAIKNYRWNKHNETINIHRFHTLASFQAFIEGFAPDESTKNLVLAEVARSMYGHQGTGFADSDTDDSPMKLIEIFKQGGK